MLGAEQRNVQRTDDYSHEYPQNGCSLLMSSNTVDLKDQVDDTDQVDETSDERVQLSIYLVVISYCVANPVGLSGVPLLPSPKGRQSLGMT